MEQEKKKILEVFDIQKDLNHKKNAVPAFSDVSLYMSEGDAIGIVGDDKSGKSQLAHVLGGVDKIDFGSVTLDGKEISVRRMKKAQKEFMSQNVQIVSDKIKNPHSHQHIIYDILHHAMIDTKTDEKIYRQEVENHLQIIKYFRESLKVFYWSKLFDYQNKVTDTQIEAFKKIESSLKNFKVDFDATASHNFEKLKSTFINPMEASQFEVLDMTNDLLNQILFAWESVKYDYEWKRFDDSAESDVTHAREKYETVREFSVKTEEQVMFEKELRNVRQQIVAITKRLEDEQTKKIININEILSKINHDTKVLRVKRSNAKNIEEYNLFTFRIETKKFIKDLVRSLFWEDKFDEVFFSYGNVNLMRETVITEFKHNYLSFIGSDKKTALKILKNFFDDDIKEKVKLAMLTNLNENHNNLKQELSDLIQRKQKLIHDIHKIPSSLIKDKSMTDRINEARVNLFESQKSYNQLSHKFSKQAEKSVHALRTANEHEIEVKQKQLYDLREQLMSMAKKWFMEIKKVKTHNDDFHNNIAEHASISADFSHRIFTIKNMFRETEETFKLHESLKTLLGVSLKTIDRKTKKSIKKAIVKREMVKVLNEVGLGSHYLANSINEFDDEVKSRINLARAVISSPKVLVIEESVATLQIYAKTSIVALLKDIRRIRDMTMVFTCDDLRMAKDLGLDTLFVMLDGKMVERSITQNILETPFHPYTKHLVEKSKNNNSAKDNDNFHQNYDEFDLPKYFKINESHEVFATHDQFEKWMYEWEKKLKK